MKSVGGYFELELRQGAEYHEKALVAGFDGYAIKTNKATILKAVNKFLMED